MFSNGYLIFSQQIDYKVGITIKSYMRSLEEQLLLSLLLCCQDLFCQKNKNVVKTWSCFGCHMFEPFCFWWDKGLGWVLTEPTWIKILQTMSIWSPPSRSHGLLTQTNSDSTFSNIRKVVHVGREGNIAAHT